MKAAITRWGLAGAFCAMAGCSGGPADVPPPKDYKGPLPKAGTLPVGGEKAPKGPEQKQVKPES